MGEKVSNHFLTSFQKIVLVGRWKSSEMWQFKTTHNLPTPSKVWVMIQVVIESKFIFIGDIRDVEWACTSAHMGKSGAQFGLLKR